MGSKDYDENMPKAYLLKFQHELNLFYLKLGFFFCKRKVKKSFNFKAQTNMPELVLVIT